MRIEHDFHVHTTLSLCADRNAATLDAYLELAKKQGIKKLGFADHMWDAAIPGASEGFYKQQDFVHVSQLRQAIRDNDGKYGIKLYFGCETEYDPLRKDIALTEEIAQEFDFILVPNSHTHMMMPKAYYEPKELHARFMLDAFRDIVSSPLAKYVTSIAHPFAAVCCPYDNRVLYDLISPAQYREVFCMAKEADIAIEINIYNYPMDHLAEIMDHPSLRMFDLAKECGCKFTFGSDAHSATPGNVHDRWAAAYVLAQLLNLKEDDLAEIVR